MRQHLHDFAAAEQSLLAAPAPSGDQRFTPESLAGLPSAARRYLERVIPARTPLFRAVRISMRGEIRLRRRWLPFTARQILRAGRGFVWRADVGGRLIRFTGADLLTPDGARTAFRFQGLIPIVDEEGDDVRRSAAGRLAAETATWLPHVLTPQAGASWNEIDRDRATVHVATPLGDVPVDLEVNALGQLVDVSLQRWRNDVDTPGYDSFGSAIVEEFEGPHGRVAGEGFVAWGWNTAAQHDGEFFRYEVTSWEPCTDPEVIDLRADAAESTASTRTTTS